MTKQLSVLIRTDLLLLALVLVANLISSSVLNSAYSQNLGEGGMGLGELFLITYFPALALLFVLFLIIGIIRLMRAGGHFWQYLLHIAICLLVCGLGVFFLSAWSGFYVIGLVVLMLILLINRHKNLV